MKKILFSILCVGALLTSCDMDKAPVGVLSDETAIQTEADALKFRNGIYNNIRSISAGAYIYLTEIQADQFVPTLDYGNRLGIINLGNITSSDQDYVGYWEFAYSNIAAVNYFLPEVEKLLAGPVTDAQKIALQRYRGEAHWARAFNYWFLADHYCNSYTLIDPTTPNSGLPLVTTYEPTGDYDLYKGRSTLAEIYAQIESDLTQAYTDLDAYEKSGVSGATANMTSGAAYLSTYAVLALQARVALLKGDYDTAINKAEAVIAGPFTLANTDNYYDLWDVDRGTELIFVPYGDNAQNAAIPATGSAWISNQDDVADYIPSASTLAMYDQFDDIRYDAFFATQSLTSEKVPSPTFVKFPGNPEFNTGSNNALKNKPKPFRLSEIYLILAEAAAQSATPNPTKANSALNTLRKNRIFGYTDQTYSGATLIQEIRTERAKELIGEGFRLSDLRRWSLGFSRDINYTGNLAGAAAIIIPANAATTYKPGDYRYVLPIPTDEMETNPQLAGHQNPGY